MCFRLWRRPETQMQTPESNEQTHCLQQAVTKIIKEEQAQSSRAVQEEMVE